MTDSMTPEQRSLRARVAAYSLHASIEDEAAHTAPARKAFLDGFERQADPDGLLEPAERARRAEQLMKAHMTNLALRSSRARAKKKTA